MSPRTGIKCTTHSPRLLPTSVGLADDSEIVNVFAKYHTPWHSWLATVHMRLWYVVKVNAWQMIWDLGDDHLLPSLTLPYPPLPSLIIPYHPLPSLTIHYHPLPSLTIHYHPLPSITIPYHPLPSITIHYHPFPSHSEQVLRLCTILLPVFSTILVTCKWLLHNSA